MEIENNTLFVIPAIIEGSVLVVVGGINDMVETNHRIVDEIENVGKNFIAWWIDKSFGWLLANSEESVDTGNATEQSGTPTAGAPMPPDNGEEKPSNIKKANQDYLEKNGVDAHSLKEEFFGRGSNTHYDIYVDKGTNQL